MHYLCKKKLPDKYGLLPFSFFNENRTVDNVKKLFGKLFSHPKIFSRNFSHFHYFRIHKFIKTAVSEKPKKSRNKNTTIYDIRIA